MGLHFDLDRILLVLTEWSLCRSMMNSGGFTVLQAVKLLFYMASQANNATSLSGAVSHKFMTELLLMLLRLTSRDNIAMPICKSIARLYVGVNKPVMQPCVYVHCQGI